MKDLQNLEGPALSYQPRLLDILFDHMRIGIAILDRELRVQRFNPTWAEYVVRYSPGSAGRVVPGVSLLEFNAWQRGSGQGLVRASPVWATRKKTRVAHTAHGPYYYGVLLSRSGPVFGDQVALFSVDKNTGSECHSESCRDYR
jgi:hypothetical protein